MTQARHLLVEVGEPLSDLILVPVGMATPHAAVTAVEVSGGRISAVLTEAGLGLGAALIAPTGGPLQLSYTVAAAPTERSYPEAAFRPRANRYTTAVADLATASRSVAAQAGGGRTGIEALVAETEARFAYDHPELKFNEGHDAVPYLSCGLTPGSCVDINTYLVASLRAAGYDAAYVYGYFFPAERGGTTNDMHCWVVTREAGEPLEWDIAHHMKAGLGAARPGLNPRPGERVALGHSMGHYYALPWGLVELKLLAEPMRVAPAADPVRMDLVVRYPERACPTP